MPRDEVVAHLERVRRRRGGARPGGCCRPDHRSGTGRLRRATLLATCTPPGRSWASACSACRTAPPAPRRRRRSPADRRRRTTGIAASFSAGPILSSAAGSPATRGRGAAGIRSRCRPLVREGPMGAAPAGLVRSRLVAGGGGLPRPAARGPAGVLPPASGPTPWRMGPRWRPRSATSGPCGRWGVALGSATSWERRVTRRASPPTSPTRWPWGDARYRELMGLVAATAADGARAPRPEIADPAPFMGWRREGDPLDGVRGGRVRRWLRPDHRSGLPGRRRFDEGGFAIQVRGRRHGRRRALLRRDPLPANLEVV